MDFFLDELELRSYQYVPLENSSAQIRLLEVLNHTKSEGQIKCQLTTWDLNRAPSYYAISYTWGPNEPTETFRLNYGWTAVRKNCGDVLRQHIYFNPSRHYWIDALCIDQNGIREKNHQVALMGQIYRCAAHVLVCLGEEDDDAEYSFGFVCKLWGYYFSKVAPTAANQRLSTRGFESLGIDSERFARSLTALTRRSYFERVWVVQELLLARDVTMCCGSYQLPVCYPHTDLILRAAAAYMVRAYDMVAKQEHRSGEGHEKFHDTSDMAKAELVAARNRQDSRILRLLEERWQLSERGRTASLLYALKLVSPFQCQNPMDRLYGTLGIIDWKGAEPIQPD